MLVPDGCGYMVNISSGSYWLSEGVGGYSPPDYYPKLATVTDCNNFLTTVFGGASAGVTSYHAMDGNIGTIKVVAPIIVNNTQIEPSVVMVYDHGRYYIGKITTLRYSSDNVAMLTYAMDWYTSYVYTYIRKNGNAGTPNTPITALSGKSVLYKRLTNGEFKYIADGFLPNIVNMVKYSNATWTKGADTGNLFDTSNKSYYLHYHEPISNTDHKLLYIVSDNSNDIPDPKTIWNNYCTAMQVTIIDPSNGSDGLNYFNPENVIFYGYTNIDAKLVAKGTVNVITTSDYKIYRLNYCTTETVELPFFPGYNYTYFTNSYDPDISVSGVTIGRATGNDRKVSTEYDRMIILDAVGN